MMRKQARKRRPKTAGRVKLPRIRVGLFVMPLVATAAVTGTYYVSAAMLDKDIRSIEINGSFQRVSPLAIEEAISDDLERGFVSADLEVIRGRIEALPWIDSATVARRWPSRLGITVTEQVPAAIWGENGLLNTRGELFVTDIRHVPAELPRLSGPEKHAVDVASRYLEIREQLIPLGLDLRRLHLDERGAWEMTLANGVEIRLGRRDVEARIELFFAVVADIVTGRAAEIDYIDMRYSNGFTIGWSGGSRTPVTDTEGAEELLASRGDR